MMIMMTITTNLIILAAIIERTHAGLAITSSSKVSWTFEARAQLTTIKINLSPYEVPLYNAPREFSCQYQCPKIDYVFIDLDLCYHSNALEISDIQQDAIATKCPNVRLVHLITGSLSLSIAGLRLKVRANALHMLSMLTRGLLCLIFLLIIPLEIRGKQDGKDDSTPLVFHGSPTV